MLEQHQQGQLATLSQQLDHQTKLMQQQLQLMAQQFNWFLQFQKQINASHSVHVHGLVRDILRDEKYQDPKRLEPFGYKGHSQFDEDGILQEIFNRIGTTNKTFIEFGVGHGTENDTVYLLCNGWNGLWIEQAPDRAQYIIDKFGGAIRENRLKFINQGVSRENINNLFSGAEVTGEIDLLCIDIDGNDYHVWEAINVVNPRCVAIEYNAKYAPPVEWVKAYDPNHQFDKTDYMGASLCSLNKLAERKGYSLVGCTLTGANAFFVRNDCLGDHFQAPYTPENHYQPGRYWLARGYYQGMPSNYGPYLGKDNQPFG